MTEGERWPVQGVPIPGTNDVKIFVDGDLAANVVRKVVGGYSIGATAIRCCSDIHTTRKEIRHATVLGWFRAPHWMQSSRQRAAYCPECSAMLTSIGVFEPDE